MFDIRILTIIGIITIVVLCMNILFSVLQSRKRAKMQDNSKLGGMQRHTIGKGAGFAKNDRKEDSGKETAGEGREETAEGLLSDTTDLGKKAKKTKTTRKRVKQKAVKDKKPGDQPGAQKQQAHTQIRKRRMTEEPTPKVPDVPIFSFPDNQFSGADALTDTAVQGTHLEKELQDKGIKLSEDVVQDDSVSAARNTDDTEPIFSWLDDGRESLSYDHGTLAGAAQGETPSDGQGENSDSIFMNDIEENGELDSFGFEAARNAQGTAADAESDVMPAGDSSGLVQEPYLMVL